MGKVGCVRLAAEQERSWIGGEVGFKSSSQGDRGWDAAALCACRTATLLQLCKSSGHGHERQQM